MKPFDSGPMLRRSVLAGLLLVPARARSAATSPITIYRDPGCGCCTKWGNQVSEGFGRPVKFVDAPNLSMIKHRLGVPVTLYSCHTAIIHGLIFEGHVPLKDMKLAIIMRPMGVRGLAVAGMPVGSLGMEAHAEAVEPYSVIAFGKSGQRSFSRH
jgi:hypothetical protein